MGPTTTAIDDLLAMSDDGGGGNTKLNTEKDLLRMSGGKGTAGGSIEPDPNYAFLPIPYKPLH